MAFAVQWFQTCIHLLNADYNKNFFLQSSCIFFVHVFSLYCKQREGARVLLSIKLLTYLANMEIQSIDCRFDLVKHLITLNGKKLYWKFIKLSKKYYLLLLNGYIIINRYEIKKICLKKHQLELIWFWIYKKELIVCLKMKKKKRGKKLWC